MRAISLYLIFVFLAGCSSMEKLGTYVQENPIFSEIVAVQTVVRIRDRSPFPEERGKRIETILVKLRTHLAGTGDVTIDVIEELIKKNSKWDELPRADQLLIKQVTTIIKDVYLPKDKKAPLSEEATIALEALLDRMVYEVRMF